MKGLLSVSDERVLSADFSAGKLWEVVESCKKENIKEENFTSGESPTDRFDRMFWMTCFT